MTPVAPDLARLRDASTIILIRRDTGIPSVLMGMRGANAAFMPSKYVFPGGAVDPEDADLPLFGLPDFACQNMLERDPTTSDTCGAPALLAAALRELAEETGLLIGQPGHCALAGFRQAGLMPDASPLHFIFRAITPPGRPRRFDARFFLADAGVVHGDLDDFSAACDELSHLHWVPIDEARKLQLPFITEVVLAEVSAIVLAAGEGPLRMTGAVPFFDNRGEQPRFAQMMMDQPLSERGLC